MVFKVVIGKEAKREIGSFQKSIQETLYRDYETIKKKGIEYVKVRHIQGKLFEIKSNEIRSLFTFQKERIVFVCVVFVKRTNKTPLKVIRTAKKRIKEEANEASLC